MRENTVMRFRPEPSGLPLNASPAGEDTGILWCNLGSPDAPTARALRGYLAQFLSDPRVIEIAPALWRPILHGIILRVRPARSAAKYADIWMPEGAPLKVWSARQAQRLSEAMQARGAPVPVCEAMRYGNPAIADQLDGLKASGVRRVLVLQGYPQYSGATTASVIDAVNAWCRKVRVLPEFRFVNDYHDDPGYIGALAQSVRRHWERKGRATVLVMSFHGIPARAIALGDPYEAQCRRTAQLLAGQLELSESQYKVTFQSRFGRTQWLQPYTEPTLRALGAAGVEHIDVMCPGFVADCLETLEEIAMHGRSAFMEAGGKLCNYIPCLNDDPAWIDALAAIAQRHLAGWNG